MNIFNNQKLVLTLTKMDGAKMSLSKIIKEELQVSDGGHLKIDKEYILKTYRNSNDLNYLFFQFKDYDNQSNAYLITTNSFKYKSSDALNVETISRDLDQRLREIVYEKMIKAFNSYIAGESIIHLDLNYKEIATEALETFEPKKIAS